jgi:hypothetical protein
LPQLLLAVPYTRDAGTRLLTNPSAYEQPERFIRILIGSRIARFILLGGPNHPFGGWYARDLDANIWSVVYRPQKGSRRRQAV